MQYNLIILDNNILMYEDMVYQFKNTLDSKSISNIIISYNEAKSKNFLVNNHQFQCVFFGTKYKNFDIPIHSILTDFDNDTLFEKHFSQELIENNKIACYSKITVNKIKCLYPESKVGLFHFGYSKYLDFFQNSNKDIDICFLGGFEDRRKNIIQTLSKNYTCIHTYGIFGKERQKLYNRCKIILSIASSDYMKNFTNSSRIFPAVSNGCFVIAEKCTDEEQNKILSNICINTEYDNIVSLVKYYLTFEEVREKKRQEFYNHVKTISSDIIF